MAYRFLVLVIVLFLSYGVVYSQDCLSTQSFLEVVLQHDDYPTEISWVVQDADANTLLSGTHLGDSICVMQNTCLTFSIYDTAGDGICCGYGLGFYKLFLDGNLIAEGGNYESEEHVSINCPVGSNCFASDVIIEGTYTTSYENHWYEFTPIETALYQLQSCNNLNDCAESVIIFDACEVVQENEDSPEGALFHSHQGCENIGFDFSVALEMNHTYYVKIGDYFDDCESSILEWQLNNLGPVVGCTDPQSCTYNPLATIQDETQCSYYPNPDCGDELPDLEVIESSFINSLYIDTIENNDGCLIDEGCLAGYGFREILRFTTHIENIGNADYVIGLAPSSQDIESNQFEWDNCHNHWHYEGYAEYLIYDEQDQPLDIGYKNGFCVMDLDCSMQGGSPKFGCSNMGISKQCGDIYSADLQCQWLDITDLPQGNYTMIMRVNWDQTPDATGRPESDYDNNYVQVCIHLNREGATSFTILEDCEVYTDCMGNLMGDASFDCLGECGGPELFGDISENQILDLADFQTYTSAILNETSSINSCTDLNDDDQINVVDAFYQLKCIQQMNAGGPLDPNQDHCSFPFMIHNQEDLVELRISNVDFTLQYIDIEIKHPNNQLFAIDFAIEGAILTSIAELIDAESEMILQHNETGRILGYVFSGSAPLPKQTEFIPFTRVYFSSVTEEEVCLSQFNAAINQLRETTSIAFEEDCYTNETVSIDEVNSSITIFPTIFSDFVTINTLEIVFAELYGTDGKILKTQIVSPTNNQIYWQNNMPNGIYFLQLTNQEGTKTIKLIRQK